MGIKIAFNKNEGSWPYWNYFVSRWYTRYITSFGTQGAGKEKLFIRGALLKFLNKCTACCWWLKRFYIICCWYMVMWNHNVNTELKVVFPDISCQLSWQWYKLNTSTWTTNPVPGHTKAATTPKYECHNL